MRFRDKLSENAKLLRAWKHRSAGLTDLADVLETVDGYRASFHALSDTPLDEASVLEIGFGARPLRLMTLQGMGVNALGVDIEAPVFKPTARALLRTWRSNGAERALKSAIRSIIFDPAEQRAFASALASRGITPTLDRERLFVCDAADLTIEPHTLDLIVSEDVFEHLTPSSLARLIPKMRSWLRPEGIALIRPMVFTGIAGNHLLDWFPYRVVRGTVPPEAKPWEHLRGGQSEPNTYLNQMSRQDYRDAFLPSFEILEERVRWPNLGKSFLTDELARELCQWPAEELFSNSVQFVLRAR